MYLRIAKKIVLAAGIATMSVSCQKDEISGSRSEALHIDVTAAGFAPDKTPARASENGYATSFTSGDRIGITVMITEGASTTILENNVAYEYTGSAWNPVDPNVAVHRYQQAGITYMVYYPYSGAMDGVKSADEIFAAFTPKTNQNSYSDYTSSDLMTGSGSLSGGSLNVTLVHALSLVEIILSESSSGVTLKVDDQAYTPYNISGGTWRCIVKPEDNVTLSGQYAVMGVLQSWQKADKTLMAGAYAQINVINSFYTGSVTVNYAGGSSETVSYDITTGDISVRPGEVIASVELPGAGDKGHLIGRSTSGVLTLKIHGNGDLLLRPAGADGYIPIGSYAEFQLLNTAPDALQGKYRQEADLDLMNAP